MKLCCYHAVLSLLLFLDRSYSQNPASGNDLDFDDQKVVTLGPPRDGFQRAVFDEVSMDVNQLPVEDITQTRNNIEIDAYDDKLVDLREEEPLFIPKAYRNETSESTTKSTISTTPQSIQTFGRVPPGGAVGRTFSPVGLPTLPPLSPQQPTFRPSFPQASFVPPQPPPSPPRLVAQQQLPAQVPQFVPQPQRPLTRPIALPAQPRPAFRPIQQQQQFLWPTPNPTPWSVQQPIANARQPQQPNASPSSATFGGTSRRPLPPLQPPRINLPAQSPPPQPIRPPQPPHTPPRIGPPPPSRTSPEALRTGVCRASIFYISTPLQTPARHSFTHFAITVSTDQCARTCHEFNCAIAHYDPTSGRCQFNPSTAFAIREGQCPPWPATHYKNNIHTNIPLRIFCVQCHRPIRRGRTRNRGNRFRTTLLRTHFTGRVPNSLRGSAFAKAHSVLSAQPDIITESSFGDINSKLIQQRELTPANSSTEQQATNNSNERGVDDMEKESNNSNDDNVNQPQGGEEFTDGTGNYSKLVLKKVQHTDSRTTWQNPNQQLRRGSGVTSSNISTETSVNTIRVLPSNFEFIEGEFQ